MTYGYGADGLWREWPVLYVGPTNGYCISFVVAVAPQTGESACSRLRFVVVQRPELCSKFPQPFATQTLR